MQTGKRRGSAFLYVVVLMVGTCVGFCMGVTRSGGDGEPKHEEKTVQERRPPADMGEAASVKALRSRIAELERRLAAVAAAEGAASTNEVAAVRDEPGPGRGGPRDWMENLRKNDPERYVQTTNRIAQFRLRRLERQQRNLDFLASVDTSRMSASAKKTHAALQDAIARREEIEERLHQEGLSDAERREIMEEMMAADRELRSLRAAERKNLFLATANSLGFEGEDAKEIVNTLKEVVDSTESSWRTMGPPPGGPRPPRGP